MSLSSVDSIAIETCRESIARGSKSFALASKLLPKDVRDFAAVIYAWCRRTDDAVDRAPESERPAALAHLLGELDLIYSDERPSDVVLAAFQHVVRSANIPAIYPGELVRGMKMDVDDFVYETMDDLELYCYRVAGTVGLMMCHVMGITDGRALKHAAHLGMGMQLTNICRDIAEDWQLGRIYVPNEILARYGAASLRDHLGDEIPEQARPALASARRHLLSRADSLYRSGDHGLSLLGWRCAVAIRAARKIYSAIGDTIEAQQFDVSRGRAVVPTSRKIGLVAEALRLEAAAAPSRVQRWLSGSQHFVDSARLIERPARPQDIVPVS